MYELNLVPGNDDDLAYQMFKGADDAAKILTATEKVFIETAVPVLPQPLDAGQILGVVLTSIGKHLGQTKPEANSTFRWCDMARYKLHYDDKVATH